MKLSIIICVYNTAIEYLKECLNSIYSSSLDCEYEIVFVDDGSSANYTSLTAEPHISYHKIENRGHFGARLYGIKAAKGEYIAFVDSDDTVSKNYHRPMLEKAESTGADIVINSWAFHTDRTKRVCINDSTMAQPIEASDDDILLLYSAQQGREHSYFVNWNKLYKRSLLLQTVEELERLEVSDKRLTFSEDALMNFFNFKNAKKIVNTSSGFYFYRIHDAQSVKASNIDKIKSQVECMCFTFDIMEKHIGENKHSEKIRANISDWKALMSRTHFSYAKAARSNELCSFVKSKYGMNKIAHPTLKDGSVYSVSELLGDNFSEIDASLTEIYDASRPLTARFEKHSRCITRILKSMKHPVAYSRCGEFTVPRRDIRLRDRIIHNPIVYRVGMILFKKGSKLRNFLKRHL